MFAVCQVVICLQGHILIKHPPCEAVSLPMWQCTIDVCFINCALGTVQHLETGISRS